MASSSSKRSKLLRLTLMTALVGAIFLASTAEAQQGSGRTPPSCPLDVNVEARADGNFLTWDAGGNGSNAAGVQFVHYIYRANGEITGTVESPAGDRNWTLIVTLPGGTGQFLDKEVQQGVSYSYVVTFYDGIESWRCDAVSVTAVPFFGGGVIAMVAGAGAVGAFIAFSRARK